MDVEILITSVREKRAIWDATDKKHSNRDHIKKLWLEVASECGIPSDTAKNKWRGLRENFRKEVIKQRTTTGQAAGDAWVSKWTHFNSMSFLLDQFTPRAMTGSMGSSQQVDIHFLTMANVISEERSQDLGNLIQNTDIDEPDANIIPSTSQQPMNHQKITSESSNPVRPKQFKKTLLQKMVQLEERKVEQYEKKQRMSLTEDADYHFLMSLLPSLRSIPLQRKMAVRRKIEDVFIEEQSSADTSDVGSEILSVSTTPSYHEFEQSYDDSEQSSMQYLIV